MWVRGALFALVLGGCYSPSFETCSLACAANEACPDGYRCSSGRCALAGSTCSPTIDGGDDAMMDARVFRCGDDMPQTGDVCFDTPIVINTGINTIFDAQLVDANGDGTLDLGFLATTGYTFRLRDNATFEDENTPGPTFTNTRVFAVGMLDGGNSPELIHDDSSNVKVLSYSSSWNVIASSESETANAQGIAVGPTKQGGPDSIAAVYPNRLRVYSFTTNNLTSIVQASNSISFSGGRDVAIANTQGRGFGEIGVAQTIGVRIYKMSGNTILLDSMPSTGSADAIVGCNVDGDTDEDFVYLARAEVGGVPGRVGAVRWTSSTYEVPAPQSIPNLLGALACGDLDGDGRADAVVATGGGGAGAFGILVLRGRDDGTFEPPIQFPVDNAVTHLHLGDINGDSIPDIIATSQLAGVITILLSNP